MVIAWTATIFKRFFDYFLSICLGESANRPQSIFSLFFYHPLEPPPKPFFDHFCPVDPLGDIRSITPLYRSGLWPHARGQRKQPCLDLLMDPFHAPRQSPCLLPVTGNLLTAMGRPPIKWGPASVHTRKNIGKPKRKYCR